MKKTTKTISAFLVAWILLVSTQFTFTANATAEQEIYYGIRDGEAFVECQPTWVTGDVVISSSYEGYPVTSFSDSDDVMAYIFCEGVTSVTLPNTIDADRLTGFPFCDCPTADIIVSEDNTELCVEGNVLYNKDKTKLIRYQDNSDSTSFTIPESVVEVSEMAFTNSNLKELVITNKTIKFNGDLNNGFGRHSIEDIYYCGTEEEWILNRIDEHNSLFPETTIHFEEDSSTTPSEPDEPTPPSSDNTDSSSESEGFNYVKFLDSIYEVVSTQILPVVVNLITIIFELILKLVS